MPPLRFPTYRVTRIPENFTEQELRNGFTDPIVRMSLATSHHHDTTKFATITFHNVPEILKGLRPGDYIEINIGAATIRVDSHFLGLTTLYDPGENNAVMDIIAVTGLAGHAYGSWKSRGGCFMWLRDELPKDLGNVRILIYGFDSALIKTESDASIPDFSKGLLHGVQNSRISASERQRPLVFLAHSLGGLVVKQAIISAKNAENRPENKDFFNSIYGVLLFGVPNQGIKNEELLTMVKGEPTAPLVQDLGEDSTYLDALVNSFFRNFNLEGSEVFSFYETKRTKTVKKNDRGEWERIGRSVRIVSKYSAIEGMPHGIDFHDPIPIPQNHSDIVKFSTADESYCTIKNILLKFVKKGPGVIRNRFIETIDTMEEDQKELLAEASNGKETLVKINLQFNGIGINAKANDGQTALHFAAQNGHSIVVQELLKFGVDVNARAVDEITPLHCAALNGHKEVARQLLDAGADANAKSDMGWTALHLAAERGHTEVVLLLLQNQYPKIKADMDVSAKNGQTAIQISC